MKSSLLATVLAFLSSSASAQVIGALPDTLTYTTTATGAQLVPGPGAPAPAIADFVIFINTLVPFNQITVAGNGAGIANITQVTLRGPETRTTAAPVLVTLPFTQGTAAGPFQVFAPSLMVPPGVRDLVLTGQVYLEVRSVAFPLGAIRGSFAVNQTICLPQAPVPGQRPCGVCPCGNQPPGVPSMA